MLELTLSEVQPKDPVLNTTGRALNSEREKHQSLSFTSSLEWEGKTGTRDIPLEPSLVVPHPDSWGRQVQATNGGALRETQKMVDGTIAASWGCATGEESVQSTKRPPSDRFPVNELSARSVLTYL